MYKPSRTSLNWANRAPGRAPVETRDDMSPISVVLFGTSEESCSDQAKAKCGGCMKLENGNNGRLYNIDCWCLSIK